MKFYRTSLFDRNLEDAPVLVQRKFWKQVKLLLTDLRHPSLRAKKYNEEANLWQARINRDWRFYFVISDDTFILTNLKKHPK